MTVEGGIPQVKLLGDRPTHVVPSADAIMATHDTELPEVFDTFAVQEGFDPFSDVIPSAAGGPLATDLSPEQFRLASKDAFRNAFDALANKVSIAPY
jgi:hypothetical protein